jgi:hypothetical protein
MGNRLKTFCLFVVLVLGITGSAFGATLTSDMRKGASVPNPCAADLSGTLQLHVPVIDFQGHSYWVDLQYVPNTLDFMLTNAGVVTDLTPYAGCTHATLFDNLMLHMPAVSFAGSSYWVDFTYEEGLTLTLSAAGIAGVPSTADFIGTWAGNTVVEGETRSTTFTLDGSLRGTVVTAGSSHADANNIAGTVTDGELYLTMAISDADKGNPDCANWNMTCVGTLAGDNWSVMNMTCSGTVCGAGGGQPFSCTGDLLLMDRSPL